MQRRCVRDARALPFRTHKRPKRPFPIENTHFQRRGAPKGAGEHPIRSHWGSKKRPSRSGDTHFRPRRTPAGAPKHHSCSRNPISPPCGFIWLHVDSLGASCGEPCCVLPLEPPFGVTVTVTKNLSEASSTFRTYLWLDRKSGLSQSRPTVEKF